MVHIYQQQIVIALCMLVVPSCSLFDGKKKGKNADSAIASQHLKVEDYTISDPFSEDSVSDEGSPTPPSLTENNLMWKRYRAIENDLASGLALTKQELCNELGTSSCIDSVHLTLLGGNDPLKGSYTRLGAPSILTPIAIDRVVLSACARRVSLDQQRDVGAAVVFKFFPLDGSSLSDNQAEQQAILLYQQLLARNPTDSEIAIIKGEAQKSTSNSVFAKSLCFAIASSVEFNFL